MNRHSAFRDDDERERALAVLMAAHPRLGLKSPLPGDLVGAIARLCLTPVVERPIALHFYNNDASRYPADDFVSAFHEGAALSDTATPFVCTAVDRGVPVFRARLRQQQTAAGGLLISSITYCSRRRDDGARVSFAILLAPQPSQQQLPFAVILEHQFNQATTTMEDLIHQVEAATPAALLAFRARNTLGVELHLTSTTTMTTTPLLTPILLVG